MNIKNMFAKFGCLLALCCAVAACGGGGDDPEPTPQPTNPTTPSGTVTVSAPQVSDVKMTSATVRAQVSASKGVSVWSRGFCYSTSSSPTVDDKSVSAQLDDMMATLSGLSPSTTYYVRGYAVSALGTTYSDATSFKTEENTGSALDAYVAPSYADDYRSVADWSKRSQWNLANVHDPSVMLADDGYYYMYQTDASYGNAHVAGGHFHARRSKNLVDWEYLGGTMSAAPAWVKDSLNNSRARFGLPAISSPQYGYWAPCARRVKAGLYRMYYCVVVDNYIKSGKANTEANFDGSWTERAFIGVMETADPASNVWEDKGFVVSSMSDRGTDWARKSTGDWNGYFYYNAIDPSYVITPQGDHWLIFGSWHSGFAALQLDGATGKPLGKLPEFCTSKQELDKVMKRVYTRDRNSRWQGSEAPEVVYRDGYYYLFLAYDGLDVPYNTRVVRSESVDGPYLSIAGTNVTANGGDALPVVTHPYKFSAGYGWVGISHCAVFDDGNGNWFYASQQRFPTTAGGNAPNAVMMGGIRSIRWTRDGWPVVMPERYGAVPDVAITEEELIGTWEHIDLSYKYGEMKSASDMVLSADHTISSGTWKGGKWSFDASTNTLTANGVELLLARECDWESSPRKHTIVYAGMTSTKTYWGKKK